MRILKHHEESLRFQCAAKGSHRLLLNRIREMLENGNGEDEVEGICFWRLLGHIDTPELSFRDNGSGSV